MAEDDKLSDVARPGKSVPDPTSRPIIVGHGARMKQDPMMQTAEKVPSTDVKKVQSSVQRNKVVAPVSQPEKAEPSTEQVDKADTKIEAGSSDAATMDAVLDQASPRKKIKDNDNDDSKEVAAHRHQIDRLVADKTYYLPIGHVTRRKKAKNSMLVLVLFLLITVAGVFFAYQTGLLKSLF